MSTGRIGASAHEFSNVLDGLAGFWKPSDLEHMDHTRPDFELHRDTVRNRLLRHSDTVVAEHFVLANLNQQRWNAAVVAKDG